MQHEQIIPGGEVLASNNPSAHVGPTAESDELHVYPAKMTTISKNMTDAKAMSFAMLAAAAGIGIYPLITDPAVALAASYMTTTLAFGIMVLNEKLNRVWDRLIILEAKTQPGSEKLIGPDEAAETDERNGSGNISLVEG